MLVLIRGVKQSDMGLFDTMSEGMDVGVVKHSYSHRKSVSVWISVIPHIYMISSIKNLHIMDMTLWVSRAIQLASDRGSAPSAGPLNTGHFGWSMVLVSAKVYRCCILDVGSYLHISYGLIFHKLV